MDRGHADGKKLLLEKQYKKVDCIFQMNTGKTAYFFGKMFCNLIKQHLFNNNDH